MRYEEMVEALQQQLDNHDAEDAGTVLAATVQALSENAWREAADFRSQLPEPLSSVQPAGPGDRASADEFVARVDELCGATTTDARAYTEAAFRVLSRAVSDGQMRQLMRDVPSDYAALAPPIVGLTGDAETLLSQVCHEAGLDTVEHARELTEAVLITTAEAASGGQAARLAENLPADIGEFLRGAEPAQHTDTDRFLNEIIRRSRSTTPALVRTHTSAVYTALHEWAPTQLADTLGQLPRPLAELATGTRRNG